MFKKYYLIAFCSTTMNFAMDTQKLVCLHQAFVVVVDHDDVICLNDAKRPGQLQLPGGIVASDKSPIETARNHLEEQTGISIATNLLDFLAQSTRVNANKQKLVEQCYYLVENRRLKPSKEDSDDIYTIPKSVDELVEGKPYFPRDHGKSSLQVGIVLQKVAQYIKTGCTQYDEQVFLENKNEPDCKTYLELFPKKKSQ